MQIYKDILYFSTMQNICGDVGQEEHSPSDKFAYQWGCRNRTTSLNKEYLYWFNPFMHSIVVQQQQIITTELMKEQMKKQKRTKDRRKVM